MCMDAKNHTLFFDFDLSRTFTHLRRAFFMTHGPISFSYTITSSSAPLFALVVLEYILVVMPYCLRVFKECQ